MEWLQHRLTPGIGEIFPEKKFIPVLSNASYHHGREDDVRVLEIKTKMYKDGLLRLHRVMQGKRHQIERQNENGDTLKHRFEIPWEPGSSFPNANQEGGASATEVVLAASHFFLASLSRNVGGEGERKMCRPFKIYKKILFTGVLFLRVYQFPSFGVGEKFSNKCTNYVNKNTFFLCVGKPSCGVRSGI